MARRLRSAGLALALVAAGLAGGAQAADTDRPRAVLELFTSQGCSSCPAADRLLAEYARRDDVLALSFHVDYWNYLGWADTFSRPEFTERQKLYAASLGRRGIYTPQMVINGRDHAVGSRKGDIEAAMARHGEGGAALPVALSVDRRGDTVVIRGDAAAGDATLWVVYFDRAKEVEIARGENRGSTVTYHNVVGDMAMVGMMKGGKLQVELPLEAMKQTGYDGCAFILQRSTPQGTPAAIIGAAVMADLSG